MFREKLIRFSELHGEPQGVTFKPVGWEETIGGVGRPQELINEELRNCDYAVFLLHDRWGSRSSEQYSSGTEEEWTVAEELRKSDKIRNIVLFFKDVENSKLVDPGDQLQKVLEFKRALIEERRHLFGTFKETQHLADKLEGHLTQWLRSHAQSTTGSTAVTPPIPSSQQQSTPEPSFALWISETHKLLMQPDYDAAGALFVAARASQAASSADEIASASEMLGFIEFNRGQLLEALRHLDRAIQSLEDLDGTRQHSALARAMFNKGITLSKLGRSEEEVAAYDGLLKRFNNAKDLGIREQVAEAMVNKGVTLGILGRGDEEIAVYDDLLKRLEETLEPELGKLVAKALLNKANALGTLGCSDEAIVVYDELLRRFGETTEFIFEEEVGSALFNKGVTLGILDRSDEEISAYDELLNRFDKTKNPVLLEQVAKTLLNKGVTLENIGQHQNAVSVFVDLVERFNDFTGTEFREQVAKAILNMGIASGILGRHDQAVSIFDDLLLRFGDTSETSLLESVAAALVNRGLALGNLNRHDEAITAFEYMLERFNDAPEIALREEVANALANKGIALGILNRKDEAIAVYDDLIKRFSNSLTPSIAKLLAVGRTHRDALHSDSR